MKKTLKDMESLAMKGYQVAFKKKSNADKYRRLLRRYGYNSGVLRSWGVTLEGGYAKSYYVIAEKSRGQKQLRVRNKSLMDALP